MAYTVKQLATISGTSVRALHFYDETGLLKPAYLGANGYRHYEEPQLLTLQQILFYRELGFELKQIKRILGRREFAKTEALKSHRETLEKKLRQTRLLIQTIDKTIQHLKGKRKMQSEEMFAGFTVAAGDDRFGEHHKLGGPGGEPIDCKLSAKDTEGAVLVFEFSGSGWPKHLHLDQDEWIYVIDGEFEFQLGKSKKSFRVGPGESVYLPRKVPHVWCTATGKPGRLINVYQPAGQMERFFRELSKPPKDLITKEQLLDRSYSEQQVKAFHQLFSDHGMHLLGPPLGFE